MKLISFLFVILIIPILTSCTEDPIVHLKGGPTYIEARVDQHECQLVCIGERNFPSQVSSFSWGWDGLTNDPKRKNSKGRVKGYDITKSIFPKLCVVARYAWNAMDKVEIDYGEQICAAQANKAVRKNEWHCNSFNSSFDEKIQIKTTLESCEEKRVVYRSVSSRPKPSFEDLRNKKITQAKNTCRKLGFTEPRSLADCSLKIYNTEHDFATSRVLPNSNDALSKQMGLNNSIMLMQQGLKLMSPTRPSLNCRTTLMGWTCN